MIANIRNSAGEHEVQFCVSGGRSPNTRKALRLLLLALAMDNKQDKEDNENVRSRVVSHDMPVRHSESAGEQQ